MWIKGALKCNEIKKHKRQRCVFFAVDSTGIISNKKTFALIGQSMNLKGIFNV